MQKREQREIARIGEVLAFLTADTCQAQLLMQHFGEDPTEIFASAATAQASGSSSSAAGPYSSCGDGCQRCRDGKAMVVPSLGGASVDKNLWKQLVQLVDTGVLPKDSPRLLARFAFGYSSPRINSMKLRDHDLWGRFAGCSFVYLFEVRALVWRGWRGSER